MAELAALSHCAFLFGVVLKQLSMRRMQGCAGSAGLMPNLLE